MIYVNGDSWSQNQWRKNQTLDYSWPNILSKLTGIEVLNESSGCGSNSRMLDNLHRLHYRGVKPSLIIIALTDQARWHLPGPLNSVWNISSGTVINDRSGIVDESIKKWWILNSFDVVEYSYQYYNIIYQIKMFCDVIMHCPVIFFNAWQKNVLNMNKLCLGTDIEIDNWVKNNAIDKNDYSINYYVEFFKFFRNQFQQWDLDFMPWIKFITEKYIDGPDGLHPYHPSPEGHQLIAQYVYNKIYDNFKEILT
jgi:hypothetical protein